MIPTFPAPDHKFAEDGLKMEAKLFLIGSHPRRLAYPTQREWIGLNLLERDNELDPILKGMEPKELP